MADSSKKSYYEDVIKDAGLDPITSEELQSKFDAITKAEYDKQRTNLQTATNKYYNQLYDTQQTTMDTIRQANAQAVASGASKGVQAANELSALLGLQSEAVTGATDLANQATTLAQDESQAMLENMLNAETQAAEQNQALAQILTQAGSVDVENQNADTAKQQVLQQYWDKYLQAMADGNTDAADAILAEMRAYSNDTSLEEAEKEVKEEQKENQKEKEQEQAAQAEQIRNSRRVGVATRTVKKDYNPFNGVGAYDDVFTLNGKKYKAKFWEGIISASESAQIDQMRKYANVGDVWNIDGNLYVMTDEYSAAGLRVVRRLKEA